jgi:hypothetical protein
MNELIQILLPTVVTIVIVLGAILTLCMYLVLAERKVSAWMQDRIGPNRVGPFGLLQPAADGLKILLKESVLPAHVDKGLFIIAPAISMFTTMLAFAVVPFGPVESQPWWMRFIIAPNVDIGIVFIFAVGSLAVYGVILGGWASNNKYSALGSLRASAQVVSYEIPLGHAQFGKDPQPAGRRRLLALELLVSATGMFDFLCQLTGRVEPVAVRLVGVRAGTRRRLSHRVRRLADGDVLRGRVHASRHDQLSDIDPVFRRLVFSVYRYTGKRVLRRLGREGAGFDVKGVAQCVSDHADSLDDSSLPV